jgi:hypothetical protein
VASKGVQGNPGFACYCHVINHLPS